MRDARDSAATWSGMRSCSTRLTGVTDEDVEQARRFFLRYGDERLLESTKFGDVLARADPSQPARIYVKGLFVAGNRTSCSRTTSPSWSAALRRALNRGRSNVGRTAYSDRVKAILTARRSSQVATPLAEDLNAYMPAGCFKRTRNKCCQSCLAVWQKQPCKPERQLTPLVGRV
jgi:hypothetical protein